MVQKCKAAICGADLFVDGLCYRCEAREDLANLRIAEPDAVEVRGQALVLLRLAKAIGDRLVFGRNRALELIRAELDALSPLVEVTVVLDTADRVCRCGLAAGDITTERHAARHPEAMTVPSVQW